ncbi:DUF5615 family PIN-like protein [Candidatus Pacearchaeota archaeon]|nr:DUF5615 family PIN-like protein [Candidatus Pacearchaeota archaeon]
MSFQSNLKILADENIPIKTAEFLRKIGFDVEITHLGADDKYISRIAKNESRVILTFDKHFINRHLFPPKEYHGIIFLNIHPPIIETINSSLKKLLSKMNYLDIKGKLFIISSFGVRVRE